MTSQQRWNWALDYYNFKIGLLYSLYSCKIRSWSLRFRQFDVCQVNTAQCSTLLHSYLLNKWAKFITKIFSHFWDIVTFVLGYFLGLPCSTSLCCVLCLVKSVWCLSHLQSVVILTTVDELVGLETVCCFSVNVILCISGLSSVDPVQY